MLFGTIKPRVQIWMNVWNEKDLFFMPVLAVTRIRQERRGKSDCKGSDVD